MTLDDALRKRQAKTGSLVRLRGEERLEQGSLVLTRNSMTVIGNHEMDLIASLSDSQTKSSLSRQRVQSVHDEIRYDLQHFPGEDFCYRALGQIPNQMDSLLFDRSLVNADGGFRDGHQIDRARLPHLLRESEGLLSDVTQVLHLLLGQEQILPNLNGVVSLLQCQVVQVTESFQRILDFVHDF